MNIFLSWLPNLCLELNIDDSQFFFFKCCGKEAFYTIFESLFANDANAQQAN